VLVDALIDVWKLVKDVDEVVVGECEQLDVFSSASRSAVRRLDQHLFMCEHFALT